MGYPIYPDGLQSYETPLKTHKVLWLPATIYFKITTDYCLPGEMGRAPDDLNTPGSIAKIGLI